MDKLKNIRPILKRHCIEALNYLFDNEIHFSLQCKSADVSFEPELPDEIKSGFHPIIDFILAGFTFESVEMWEEQMSFEAGFGKENFSTCVSIPFSSIIQVYIPSPSPIIPHVCVFMNALNLLDLTMKNEEIPLSASEISEESEEDFIDSNGSLGSSDSKSQNDELRDDDLIESSRKAIMSNPKNKFR